MLLCGNPLEWADVHDNYNKPPPPRFFHHHASFKFPISPSTKSTLSVRRACVRLVSFICAIFFFFFWCLFPPSLPCACLLVDALKLGGQQPEGKKGASPKSAQLLPHKGSFQFLGKRTGGPNRTCVCCVVEHVAVAPTTSRCIRVEYGSTGVNQDHSSSTPVHENHSIACMYGNSPRGEEKLDILNSVSPTLSPQHIWFFGMFACHPMRQGRGQNRRETPPTPPR